MGLEAQSQTVPPSEFEKLRASIGTEFQRAAELIGASRRSLPTNTGDGTYLNLVPDTPETIKRITGTLKDLSHLGISDISTLMQVQSKQSSHGLWDDKEYLMEKLIRTAVEFPDNSEGGRKVTNGFLESLYNDLEHPPVSILGKDYKYRSADGSFNSLKHPNLGKAGMPYARTTAPKTMQPGALPDAGVIFDSIMARKPENMKKHPNQISSILFYLASIIIHDIFRTNHDDFHVSDTSSYLDLAPLYGSNITEQMAVRTGLDGKLKTDAFSEVRLLSFPPAVGVMLVMFNRFHQHVVEQLALINEGNQFARPEGEPPKINTKEKEWWTKVPEKWRKYDEDLFQVGRLVTSGLYINIILIDYVRTILNLNKTNSNWALDPRAEMRNVEVAAGNQVSAEFNLVYRWHSTVSERDEKWTEDFIKKQFAGMDPNTVPLKKFLGQLGKMQHDLEVQDPGEREWGPFKRQADGSIPDDDLVEAITASIEDCANSYGANRVPVVMRAIEILGIEQARSWSLASLNEFRKYFHLKPHETFEDINSDPYVAKQLERLYDHPDQVELYPGLVAEEAKKPSVPGAGLCPSYTVSRAVLSDAVALVRGDRFYTVDFHPKKLTNWGYSAIATETGVNNGCVFYKLFLTAFPHHFRPNSIYAHYPMTVPPEMKKTMKDLGRFDHFNFDRPGRLSDTKVAYGYETVKKIATDNEAFKITWGGSMEYLTGPSSKQALASQTVAKDVAGRGIMMKSLSDGEWNRTVRSYFESTTLKMLRQKAYRLANFNQVDIVRDIGNLVPVHFVSELFSLPLKTKEVTSGIFTEHEMYLSLLAIYTSFLKDSDSINSFGIRQVSLQAVHTLGRLVEAHVDEIAAPGILKTIMHSIFNDRTESEIGEGGTKAIKALLASKLETKSVVWGHILSTAAGVAATQGSLFANVIEYFSKQPEALRASLNKIAKSNSDASFKELTGYVLEAARLSCETAVYRTAAKAAEFQDGKDVSGKARALCINAGDKVLLNMRSACMDPAKFTNPSEFNPKRDPKDYLHLGMGPHDNLGFETTTIALTAMCKVVLALDKFAAAKGAQGVIHKVPRLIDVQGTGADPVTVEGYHGFLTENWDQVWPVPQTMKINWV